MNIKYIIVTSYNYEGFISDITKLVLTTLVVILRSNMTVTLKTDLLAFFETNDSVFRRSFERIVLYKVN